MTTITDPSERFFGSIPYLLPLIYALPFGSFLLSRFPVLTFIYTPLYPLINLINGVPFSDIVIFFVLLLLVVRNPRISHFIRFNTYQAILINIALALLSLLMRVLSFGGDILIETLMNTVFLAVSAACIYSMLQSILGKYPELSTISQEAHRQVPF